MARLDGLRKVCYDAIASITDNASCLDSQNALDNVKEWRLVRGVRLSSLGYRDNYAAGIEYRERKEKANSDVDSSQKEVERVPKRQKRMKNERGRQAN